MNRREMILQSTASVGTIALSMLAGAQTMAAEKASPGRNLKLADATKACIKTGLICISFCQKELAEGNKSMAECLQSVLELVASCESLEKLALYNSKHTQAFAQLTGKICGECAKTCEKHAAHMEECKACMEACKDCEKACLAA